MDIKLAKKLIRTVGSECGYTVSGKPSDNSFDVYFDRNRHGVAFQIKHSTHPKAEKNGWLQVHHYEGEPEEWGVALHSLRSIGDVVGFCQVLISFEKIKAKRKD